MKFYINEEAGSFAAIAAGDAPAGHKQVSEKKYNDYVKELNKDNEKKANRKRAHLKKLAKGFKFDGVDVSTTERDSDRVVAAVMSIKNGYLEEKLIKFTNGTELLLNEVNLDAFAQAFFVASGELEKE